MDVTVTKEVELGSGINRVHITMDDGTQWAVTPGPSGKLVVSGGVLPVSANPYDRGTWILEQHHQSDFPPDQIIIEEE